jgi:hypothetical protein
MSLKRSLRDSRKTNEEFETMLGQLTLDEVIGLRLELENDIYKDRLYGFKLYSGIREILNKSLIIFALDTKQTKLGASRLLGMNVNKLKILMYRYNIRFDGKGK